MGQRVQGDAALSARQEVAAQIGDPSMAELMQANRDDQQEQAEGAPAELVEQLRVHGQLAPQAPRAGPQPQPFVWTWSDFRPLTATRASCFSTRAEAQCGQAGRSSTPRSSSSKDRPQSAQVKSKSGMDEAGG